MHYTDPFFKINMIIDPDLKWSSSHEKLIKTLTEERIKKINSYVFSRDKILSLYGACLANLAISDLLKCPIETLRFNHDPSSKPRLDPSCNLLADKVDYNISHTESAAIAAAALNHRIGVDIEYIKDAPFNVMPYVFNKNEIEYVKKKSASKSCRFFEIWTRKEAYTKCLGTGLCCDLISIDTLNPPKDICIITHRIKDHIYSICAADM